MHVNYRDERVSLGLSATRPPASLSLRVVLQILRFPTSGMLRIQASAAVGILTSVEMNILFLFYFILFWFFETGFLCVALAVLEPTLYTRPASNSEIHLPLPPKCWDQRRAPPCPAQETNILNAIEFAPNHSGRQMAPFLGERGAFPVSGVESLHTAI